MSSTPSRQASATMGSSTEPNPRLASNAQASYPIGAAFAPPGASYTPQAAPSQFYAGSPAPPLQTDQTPAYAYSYSGQTFRAPVVGPGTIAAPPSSASGQMYQRPPGPARPPGGLPSVLFTNAGPPLAPPVGSLPSRPSPPPPLSTGIPPQMITGGSQTGIPGSFPSSINPTSALPGRVPPSFGLVQGFPPATYQPPPMVNPSSAMPGIPGPPGSQGFLAAVPSSRPELAAQAYPPPQFRPTPLPGSQSTTPYSQYGGQPPMASTYSDGQSSRGSLPYPGTVPPFGGVQGLAEEFRSLSMATVPRSMEATVDPSSLPRPSADATEYPASSWVANCHPRYVSLTCSSIPNSHSLVARWHLPLGAVVHPLAKAPPEEEVPVINFGTSGIIRCRRCRTYVNPYVVFTDGGRRWRCNVCGLLNEVPSEYFCALDQNGRRRDADERPELCQGSVEFVAPAEYMVRPPMPPVYFFLIDVSSSAIKTGMLQIAVDTIKSCLDKLPGFPRTQIGFLTFDTALHFYSLKSSLTQPQMMLVADLDDPFLPMPDDLLVNLSDSRAVVEALLDSLPSMFQNNSNVESAVGPALRAVFMIMSQLGGKLLLLQSTLPSLGAGRLKIRGEDPHVYGSDKEFLLRTPEDSFYKQMAADFSKFQIGVNLYSFSENYMDLASLGTLSKYTGGQVYYYPSFQPHLHREKFSYELARDLTRETAWEAVMRIRCGKGVRFNTFHGHFMLQSSDLMALPVVDCDKAFAMQLTLEDTLLTSQTVYFQVALLYTSSNGERRIRIHTVAAPVVTELNELYRTADIGAIMSLMSRLALEKSLVSKLEDARQSVQVKLVRCLREYRNIHGVQHPLTGRLIYPESLKLLPLYCLSLCKSLALRGGYADATSDERSAACFDMMVMSTPRLLKLLYPSLIRLDDYLLKSEADFNSLKALPLTSERLDPRGAFLLNDGLRLIIWLGKVLPSDLIIHLLGMEAASSADLSKVAVVEQNNELSKQLTSVLRALRVNNPALYQQCFLVRQGDQPKEGFLVLFNLVEDRTTGSFGYTDWMVQIHRQVQQKA